MDTSARHLQTLSARQTMRAVAVLGLFALVSLIWLIVGPAVMRGAPPPRIERSL